MVWTLSTRPVGIGREEGDDVGLAIPDTQISRLHARVEHDAGADAYVISDAGSRNGVYVQGVRVERAPLRHGHVVRLGSSLLVYADYEVAHDEQLLPPSQELLGASVAMQRVRGEIALVARERLSVLVLGESGVGKERVATEIHRQSGRSGRLCAVNCAAIPRDLAESQLFGHAAGAFTGAVGRNDGLFVAGDGGTLFLDEVGELAPEVQPKLLRVLATGEVQPVGASTTRKVDVRIVAATLRDLEAGVAEEAFRGDLFARLSEWVLRVPPLRERREDILALGRAWLERQERMQLSSGAAEAVLLHDWPFNVRELQQTLVAAALRARGGVIGLEHLPDAMAARRGDAPAAPAGEPPLALLVDREDPSREDMVRVLSQFRGNLSQMAEFFGRDRKQMYRWLRKYGLEVAAYRKPGDAAEDEDDEPG